jgi:hypothetical protein
MAVIEIKSTKKDTGDIYLRSKGGFYSERNQNKHELFLTNMKVHRIKGNTVAKFKNKIK